MISPTQCQRCGTQIPSDSILGQCPNCLFGVADLPPENGNACNFYSKERRVGDYVLQRQIGSGGMGVVYEAVQLSLNRKVALKFIRDSQIASPALLRRFTIEAEAAARLHHANIVKIHEIGDAEGQPYFSMDLIEGHCLRSRIGKGEFRVSKEESSKSSARTRQVAIARFVAKTARAVHHAHQRGVLHRDLKPANILIDAHGEPHLTDFGLAKILRQDGHPGSGDTRLTGTGDITGTPSYMAPEQVSSSPATASSDVYGLGAILYEMLLGHPPFQAPTPLETLRQVQEQRPKSPKAVNPSIDRDLDTICLKCLEKDPRHRYSSAEALAEDLENWIQLKPIKARPAGPLRRMMQWVRRNPIGASFIATLCLALVVSLVVVQIVRHQRDAIQRGEAVLFDESMARILQEWHNPERSEILLESKHLSILAGRPIHHTEQANQLTIGISIIGDPVIFAQTRAPLFDEIQQNMSNLLQEPVAVHLKLFKYSGDDADLLVQGRADLILLDPAWFLRAQAASPGIFAVAREKTSSEAVIVIRSDSPVTHLTQLADRSVAFTGPLDAITVWAKARLYDTGLSRKKLAATTNFLDQSSNFATNNTLSYTARKSSRRETVAAVLNGSVTAGVTTLRRFELEKHKGLKLVDRFVNTPPIYAARAGLPSKLADAFRQALLRIKIDVASPKEGFDWDDPFPGATTVDPPFMNEFRAAYEKAERFDRE